VHLWIEICSVHIRINPCSVHIRVQICSVRIRVHICSVRIRVHICSVRIRVQICSVCLRIITRGVHLRAKICSLCFGIEGCSVHLRINICRVRLAFAARSVIDAVCCGRCGFPCAEQVGSQLLRPGWMHFSIPSSSWTRRSAFSPGGSGATGGWATPSRRTRWCLGWSSSSTSRGAGRRRSTPATRAPSPSARQVGLVAFYGEGVVIRGGLGGARGVLELDGWSWGLQAACFFGVPPTPPASPPCTPKPCRTSAAGKSAAWPVGKSKSPHPQSHPNFLFFWSAAACGAAGEGGRGVTLLAPRCRKSSIIVAADESTISWGPSPTFGELVRRIYRGPPTP